ncbi:hypothetical protein [Mycobacterium sp. IDR2000157661]|uniref:hypothetical protein n=1 Tax=Mycobacterium sp. IDR2000157661 TaxID=2867005 RepID=UPI001EEE50F4|nr:hypothetical protein [Mycobacterium sp. IDR2000157661]ULE34646.1 hypothetical protein K3G64_08630 [Mycobacterium sp. IDR2000157661]
MTVRRFVTAALLGVSLSAGVVPAVANAQPGNCCCPVGQTGVIYGCASFCVPGKALDVDTGLCVAAPPPYPHAPIPPPEYPRPPF